MSLPNPAPRKLLHNRAVNCYGYQREDGLWDIEGHIKDTKTYLYTNSQKDFPAGEPIHEMWLRLTMDLDFKIYDVQAQVIAFPKRGCGDIADHFKCLIGQSIGPGWKKRVKELVGGKKGCTHLVELLAPIATTAFQAMHEDILQNLGDSGRPGFIDTCHILASDGPEVKSRWPQFYTGKD